MTQEELETYSQAQAKTILELSKRLKLAEDKAKHLESLIQKTAPVLQLPGTEGKFGANDQESICREQLFLLKQISQNSQLSLEEARKVDIYSKILLGLQTPNKSIDTKSRDLSTQELLSVVESPDGN